MGERVDIAARLAGAPISWGVCEVPGWGIQLAPERVLAEMSSLGISATELGPTGYLGADPTAISTALDQFGMHLIGGFVPLVLHDRCQRPAMIADARRAAGVFGATGASVFVTAAVLDADWSPRRPLTDDEWTAMFEGFDLVDEICAEHGITQVLHPHVNTLVETADDVERVLEGSSVRWCLDTGHLRIGGTDPVAFARDHHDRVAHVHIKDVVLEIATSLNAKERTLMEATQDGLFCAAGEGDVAIADCIRVLEEAGYRGWYVLEQDVALTGAEPPAGGGPIEAVRVSVTNLARMTG